MKIALLNFSGNVGKTTIATSLLMPRLPNTPYLAIETINDGAAGEKQVAAEDYGALLDDLVFEDNMVVDIGSSNVENTLKKIQQYADSHEEFDYFLIPTIPGVKWQVDTKSTIVELSKMGIKPNKIRLVFNFVTNQNKLDDDFEMVIDAAKRAKIRIPTVGIETNEVYEKLKLLNLSMDDLLKDTDLRAKARTETDVTKKREMIAKMNLQRLAMTAKKNLDEVFKDLSL